MEHIHFGWRIIELLRFLDIAPRVDDLPLPLGLSLLPISGVRFLFPAGRVKICGYCGGDGTHFAGDACVGADGCSPGGMALPWWRGRRVREAATGVADIMMVSNEGSRRTQALQCFVLYWTCTAFIVLYSQLFPSGHTIT